jgi:hypothetical protein
MSAMEVISLQTGCKGAYGRVCVLGSPHGALARNGLGLDGVCSLAPGGEPLWRLA